jgi:colanic acid/amylovoran biosynthesis protein
MTKILFINTNCSWNKGSAAQVISASKILKKFIPDASFALLSYCYELDAKQSTKYDYNLKVVGYSRKSRLTLLNVLFFVYHLFIALSRCALYTTLRKISLNAKSLLNEKYLREYVDADIIIDLSGDSFSDSKGGISPIHSLDILIGILLKKPIVFFSQSIGPFKRWNLPLVKFCLKKANLIIVREEMTKNYLEEIRINSPIHLTADCAFVLEPAPYESVRDILSKEKVDITKKPLVGISANVMLDDGGNKYANSMAQLIDYIIEKLNAQVVFVPHVVSEIAGGKSDDRVTGETIYKLTKNEENINLIKGEYSPEELKGIIGLCDIFIGGRMHANIAAISSYVPTMATAWSHKYYGIMRTVGQEKYVYDFKTMNFEELKSEIDDWWDNRENIREELKVKVKDQKKLAWHSGELVRDLLNHQK